MRVCQNITKYCHCYFWHTFVIRVALSHSHCGCGGCCYFTTFYSLNFSVLYISQRANRLVISNLHLSPFFSFLRVESRNPNNEGVSKVTMTIFSNILAHPHLEINIILKNYSVMIEIKPVPYYTQPDDIV